MNKPRFSIPETVATALVFVLASFMVITMLADQQYAPLRTRQAQIDEASWIWNDYIFTEMQCGIQVIHVIAQKANIYGQPATYLEPVRVFQQGDEIIAFGIGKDSNEVRIVRFVVSGSTSKFYYIKASDISRYETNNKCTKEAP